MLRGKKATAAKRPRVNRLLGFSRIPTDEEIDQVLELLMRMILRMVSRRDFLATMRQVGPLGDVFGDA
jgi:hypothetical protein